MTTSSNRSLDPVPSGRDSSPARRWTAVGVGAMAALSLVGCGSDGSSGAPVSNPAVTQQGAGGGASAAEMFPDVVDVTLTDQGGGQFEVATTLSSPYDSPDRYADAWRVLDESGNELGVRELDHDHASEQPFTRQETVAIPDDVDRVTVEGRDQVSGYGGTTKTVDVPR